MAGNKTIWVVRHEHEEYDRQKYAEYLARLKGARQNFMTREVPKNDRIHIEIAEVPKGKEADYQANGFSPA